MPATGDIRIKKGLDIKLIGEAERICSELPRSAVYAVRPPDFRGIVPKLTVRVGDKVKAGDALFHSKNNEMLKFTSPVSGEVRDIVRGAKRRILEVLITADKKDVYKNFGKRDFTTLNVDETKKLLAEAGCFPFFIQRPYDIIANPEDTPKAIFISGFSTVPLAADQAFALRDYEKEFQVGIDTIARLTEGKVHLSVCGNETSFFNKIENVELHRIFGKHPAGNVSVQIEKIDPVNQGERVWVIQPQNVATIGRLILTGKYEPVKVFALVGSEVTEPKYYRAKQGVRLEKLFQKQVKNTNVRYISGDVLSGVQIHKNGFLGFYDTLASVIPEGSYYTFMGWLPFTQNKLFSMSRTFFSWLTPYKKYRLDTNMNGEERAMVLTGEMERVFPMDIYPMQLLKAVLAGDIEKMEKLGIYEVAPEDFALIDYVSSSKVEAQSIIRQGLDLMIKEVG